MVKLSGFTSVNPTEKDEEGLSPTLEAEEAAVIESYEQGIQAALDGREQEAEECFRSVLSSELVVRGATEQLQRLEVLSAKNLAITVGKQSDRIEEAITLFREAIEKNPEDSGLIDRYGTLAARLGEWNASKDAFLIGLSLDNEHIAMKMKLYEVLRHLQDYQTLNRISQFLPRGTRSSQGWRNLLGDIPQAIKYDETTDDEETNKCCITVSNWMELLNEVGARMLSEERSTRLINILVTNCDDIVLELDGNTDVDLDENGFEVIEPEEKGMDQCGSGGVEETHQDKKQKVGQNSPRKTRRLRGNSTPERGSPQLDSTPTQFSFIDGWMDKIQEPSGSPMGSCCTPASAERIKDCPVMDSNPSLLLHCTGCDWTLDSLCELLLLYFSQSEELNDLEDQAKDYLIDIFRSVKRKIPSEYALRLTEWLIDGLASIKASTDLGDPSTAQGKFESLQTLAEKFLRTCAAIMEPHLIENESSGNDQCMGRARYLFAKGKYFEVLERMETAKQYFLECLDAIGCSEEGLRLGHVTEDNIVSYSRIKFKYDTLDVHSEIHKVRDLPATWDSQMRVDSLASTIFSGPERETFMLSIDRKGWSNILRELNDAAHRVKNVSVCLKCQIRLLNANLPSATSNDMRTAREQPEEYVGPLLSTTFMNVIMNSIKIENIVYHMDISIVLEDFEMEIFRDVLRRLLLVMHASYQLLCAEADHVGKKKNLKVLLSHSCAFFMALLPLEWDLDQGLAVVGVLDDSFRALGQVDALLFRKSLVPYCAIPFLVRINNCQSKHGVDDYRYGLLSELIQHLLRFAFGVILPAAEKPETIRYVTSFGSYDHRNPRCMEELIVLWPFCDKHFSSLSKQMLKKRGGEFLEKCYIVAAESLPMAMKYQMISALDKFGLLMPPKIGVCNVMADFAPRLDCTDQSSMGIDPQCELQSDALAVYRTVFHYYSRIYAPDLSALQRQEGRLLDKSDRDFETKVHACIWDLTFNRTRFENWQELAEFHQGLAEWILDECMMEGRPLTHTESLRVSRHRNIGYWCSHFAIKYSELEWNSQGMTQYRQGLMSNIFEFYGFSLLNQIADAPPEFDQCFKKPNEQDQGFFDILENALYAFIGVSRVCPNNNWSSHLFIGICLKRLGHKPSVFMPPLARACQLANEEFGAIVDPIYEIHACRLDLLESLWDFRSKSLTAGLDDAAREEILDQCALYYFREKPGPSVDDMQERVIELYTDAIEAMKWCLEVDSHYYKASLRLGKSKYYDAEKRFDCLNSLFSKGKSEFVFNMWGIVTKGQNVQKAKEKKKRAIRKDDVLIDVPYCGHQDAVKRVLNGALYADVNFEGVCAKPSQRMVGIGLKEDAQCSRIFRGKLRKALLEYIAIIRTLGAADVLDKIIMYLESGGQGIFNTEEYQDISAVCQGCKLVLNISKLDSMFPALELLELKNPTVFIYNCEPLAMFSECKAPVEHQLNLLRFMYNVFLKYLFSEGEEWLSTVVQPVSNYLLWKIRKGDTSDEMFGKFFITKRTGTRVLGQYACLYVRRLADLSETETLLDVYHEFFRRRGNTSAQNRGEFLGMVLCMNVWPVLKDLIHKELQVCTEPTAQNPAPASDMGALGISAVSGLTSVCDLISLYARNVMGYASQSMGDDFTKQLQEALCSIIPQVENLIQEVVQARKRKELGDASFQISIQESKDFLGLSPQEESRGTEQDTVQPVEEQDIHQEENKDVEVIEDRDHPKESSPMVPPGNASPESETAPAFGGGIAAEAIMAAMRAAEDA